MTVLDGHLGGQLAHTTATLIRLQTLTASRMNMLDRRLTEQAAHYDNMVSRLEGSLSVRINTLDELGGQLLHTGTEIAGLQALTASRMEALEIKLEGHLIHNQDLLANYQAHVVNKIDATDIQLQGITALVENFQAHMYQRFNEMMDAYRITAAEKETALAEAAQSRQQLHTLFESTQQLIAANNILVNNVTAQQAALDQENQLLKLSLDAAHKEAQTTVMSAEPVLVKEYRLASRPIPVQNLAGLAQTPLVSIVILQYHKSDLTRKCLYSLLRYTDISTVEVIVVDNGSAPEHIATLQHEFANTIRVLAVGVNRYYGEGNNIGVEAARGEYVVLMNNDAVVTSGWLAALMPHLTPAVGVVAPSFLYPDGRVQECGANVDENGLSQQYLKFGNQHELPREPFYCDYVSGALMLMRKRDYLQVGGLDLSYEPGYYEDVDFCLKLLAHGLRTICVAEQRIFHNENATSSDPVLGFNADELVEISRKVFLTRWKPYLANRSTAVLSRIGGNDINQQMQAASRGRADLPTAMLYLPALALNAMTKYMLTLAQTMLGTHQVTIICPHIYSRLRLFQLANYWQLNLTGTQFQVWDEIPPTQHWDVAFVLGDTLFPPFTRPADKAFYICEYPTDIGAFAGLNSAFGLDGMIADDYQYICLNEFVKSKIHSSGAVADIKLAVLPPPVHLYPAANVKEKIIVSVAEFVAHHRHDLLIEAFAKLTQLPQFQDWKLVLVGATSPEPHNRSYLKHCMNLAANLNVEWVFNEAVDVIADIYPRASVYWQGTGLGADAQLHPEQLDRIGIAPLEAASAGCIVCLANAGAAFEMAFAAPGGFYSCTDADGLWQLTARVYAETASAQTGLQTAMSKFLAPYKAKNFSTKLTKLMQT